MPAIEGHVAFGTARQHIDCLLIGHLQPHATLAEQVKAGKLHRLHEHHKANCTFHLVAKPLISVLKQSVGLAVRSFSLFLDHKARGLRHLFSLRFVA